MTETILGFTQILDNLCEYTVSNLGRELALNLKPAEDPRRVAALQLETDQARALLDRGGHVPLHGLADIRETIGRTEKGAVLKPGDLLQIGDLLRGCRRTREYLVAKTEIAPLLAGYASSLTALPDLEEIIALCIEGGRVSSQASQGLKKVRAQIAGVEQKIEQRLNSIIAGNSRYLQDTFVSQRDGRWVIPVQSSYKNKIPGNVLSTSGTGSTAFIEPEAIRKLSNELVLLRAREENEEYQVLAMLTGEVGASLAAIKINVEVMAALDLVLARGKYSRAVAGRSISLSKDRTIRLVRARHPLLPRDQAVPLDLELVPPVTTLVITGPNTGGKTVTLKTVGLLAMMHQAGLHIPTEAGSCLPVFDCILADIGDGQDISQSLSTFSSHVRNIVSILEQAGPQSLVLLDEIGTGTDPLEGAALAASVLEELYTRGAVTLASTHYSDIKRLGDAHPGFINGAMDFDRDTLKPRYRLLLGQGGQSNGLWIAQTLGVPERILSRARTYVQGRGETQGLDISEHPEAVAAVRKDQPKQRTPPLPQYRTGDRVYIPSQDIHGVVVTPANHRNQLELKIRDEVISIDARRVKLHIPREELYPSENYDLDIVLLSKEDRKLKHDMSRKLVQDKERRLR